MLKKVKTSAAVPMPDIKRLTDKDLIDAIKKSRQAKQINC
jgi:hypothetical protein